MTPSSFLIIASSLMLGCSTGESPKPMLSHSLENALAGSIEPTSLTYYCDVDPSVSRSMKLAFESRAAQSVGMFGDYVQRLAATLKELGENDTLTSRVCRLYVLDELADIYTFKFVKFDEAMRFNGEAESLLEKVACCKNGNHLVGPYFPLTRQIYSYLFAFDNDKWKGSLYPQAYLEEVSKQDLDALIGRIKTRKIFLDGIFHPSIKTQMPKTITEMDLSTRTELNLWRQALVAPELDDDTKAFLLADRIWNLRERIDQPTWLSMVQEAVEAALRKEAAVGRGQYTASIISRFRLGYALLRQGRPSEGIRMFEEMSRMVVAYQKHLESEYEHVQKAIAWEYAKGSAKANMAGIAIGALKGLSYGAQFAPYAASIAAAMTPFGIGGVVSGITGPALTSVQASIQASYAHIAETALKGIVVNSSRSVIDAMATSGVDLLNPRLEAGLEMMRYARFKSLETVRLFGNSPPGLPLFLNEQERLNFYVESGMAYDKLGRHQEAIDQYRNAVEIIESERAGLAQENTRLTFFRDKLKVYERLVLLLVKQGDVTRAFEYSERARSRNFVDLLASSRPHFFNLSESTAYERRRLDGIAVELMVQQYGLSYQEVTRLRGSGRGVQVIKSNGTSGLERQPFDRDQVKSHGESLEREYSDEFDSLSSVQAATLVEIGQHLGQTAALVGFFVGEEETITFLVQDGTATASIRPIGRTALQRHVREFRRLIQHNPQGGYEEIAAIQHLGQNLFEMLLRDSLRELRKPTVYLVPHGPLHYLPFNAVYDGHRYLVDFLTMINVPSGTVLTYLGKREKAPEGTTTVFANPDLGTPTLDLPFAEREGKAVMARHPQAILYTRKEAQEARVREASQGATILHFATHGKFDERQPMNSALLLAKGGEADGILTASEIFGLTLPRSLIVLSACETGLSQIATGDEILGMTRAFMYAGALQVIATLWEIDDQATADLMDQFYAKLKTEASASALRAAQRQLRIRHPHPFYWAGFNTYGIER